MATAATARARPVDPQCLLLFEHLTADLLISQVLSEIAGTKHLGLERK